jgi:hypothetical protein
MPVTTASIMLLSLRARVNSLVVQQSSLSPCDCRRPILWRIGRIWVCTVGPPPVSRTFVTSCDTKRDEREDISWASEEV